MKKSFSTGKTIFKFITNKHITNANHNLIRFSSTQAKEIPKRGVKTESEQRSLQDNILPNIINRREIKTRKDWKIVRNELFQAGKQITSVNIDSSILSFCIRQKNYNLAYSYMEFLKEENLKPNLATIGKYFKLFYLTNSHKVVEKSEELNILTLYKELRDKYKLLDASTCENIIYGLSITENWRECLKLFDEIKICSDPSTGTYSVIASVAFKNNDNDLAWRLLDELVEKGREPYSIAFSSYLEQCENTSSQEDCLKGTEKLFEFLKRHNLKCSIQIADQITNIYKKLQLNCNSTTINNKGICHNCEGKLEKFQLNEEEFKSLKQAIFKNVIIGRNVFCRTTPDEVERFQKFISNMQKYDVVIDGLNVAYSGGVKQPPQVFSGLVASVVKHFVNENKKILVLGRTHMQKWGRNWAYVAQHADTFLAQSLSQDDPYLLYCALNSGLNTIIVSKDLMRSHLFKLRDTQLKILFAQWLTQSQYLLQHVNNQGKVFFKYPLPYVRMAQKQGKCWHIPYNENETENKWLCLRS